VGKNHLSERALGKANPPRSLPGRISPDGALSQVVGPLDVKQGTVGQAAIFCVMAEKRFAAIGSGRHHAYGAAHALLASGMQVGRRLIELALRASAAYSSGVRPRPFPRMRHGLILGYGVAERKPQPPKPQSPG
jgi:hypothetical protein